MTAEWFLVWQLVLESATGTAHHLVAQSPPEQIGAILDRMPMDEAARILTLESPGRQDELLALMVNQR